MKLFTKQPTNLPIQSFFTLKIVTLFYFLKDKPK
jgi:hypothetical protein